MAVLPVQGRPSAPWTACPGATYISMVFAGSRLARK